MASTIRIKMLDKTVEVDLSENMLTQCTIKSLFLIPADAVVGLWYELNGRKKGCKAQMLPEPCFLLPDGWEELEFYVEADKAPLRPATPVGETPAKALTKMDVAKYFDYLLYFLDGQFRICATLVEKDLAITAGHCIPKDKKEGDYLTIFDQSNKPYEVKIVFLNKELDLALLQTVKDTFDVEPLEIASYEVGRDYFVLGYPPDEDTGCQFIKSPNVIKGCIMSRTVRKNYIYGDSGGSKGFSGGPVISLDHPRALIGIGLGGRGLPKSWPLNDFLVRALTFSGETPRLKILPASTVGNVERRGTKRSASEEDSEMS